MTAWLLSVVGVGIVSVLVNYLTQGMKLHHTVGTACKYIFILVLIFPIPTMIGGGMQNQSCNAFEDNFEYNEEIMNSTSDAYLAVLEGAVEQSLSEDGYSADCKLYGTVTGSEVNLTSALVVVKGEFSDSSVVIIKVRELTAEMLDISKDIVEVQVTDYDG